MSTRARASSLAAAAASGSGTGDLVEQALDAYERALFWQETRRALRGTSGHDPDDAAWDRTVRDGLARE